MGENLFRHIAAVIASALVMAAPAFAALITVTPSQPSLQVGDSLSVTLSISGLGVGAAPSVGAFDLDLLYDASVLSFQSAAFGNQLNILGLGSIQSVDSSVAGAVNLFELSFDFADDLNTLQSDSFVLATLAFSVVGAGASDLLISILTLGDADGNPLTASAQNAKVFVGTPSAVPLPAAGWLFLSALIMAGISRRRVSGPSPVVHEELLNGRRCGDYDCSQSN